LSRQASHRIAPETIRLDAVAPAPIAEEPAAVAPTWISLRLEIMKLRFSRL
jgi:hypothetical protein